MNYKDLISNNVSESTLKHHSEALEILVQAENRQHIWNVDYQNLKTRLNRIHNHALSNLIQSLKSQHKINVNDERFYFLNFIFYIDRERPSSGIKKIKNNRELMGNRFAEDYLAALELVQTVCDRLEALKTYIEKGRKPNQNTVEKFVPKPTSLSTRDMLESDFKELCKDLEDRLCKDLEKSKISSVEKYESLNESSKTQFYQFHYYYFDKQKALLPLEQIHIIINEKSKIEAADAIKLFIDKNVKKIGSIIDRKGGYIDIKLIEAGGRHGLVSNSVKFKLKSGESFTVFSQIVTVYARKVFFRYPTTFHNITDSRGEFHRNASEEWMNTTF